MEKIKYSVVIPLYNKEISISRALESVLNQTINNYEVIIVDDGSTDASVQQILSYVDGEKIRLIRKENGGVSSARNKGIEEAKYEYIAFLDADDCWESDFLQKIELLISQTKNAALWGGRQRIVCENGDIIYSSKSILSNSFMGYVDSYFDIAKSGILFHASSIVISKSKINSAGLKFNESLVKGEDLDFYFQIALTYKVAYIDKVLSYYHMDTENRAMKRFCPLKKRLIGNIDKYSDYLKNNIQFRGFISGYVLSCIGLLLNEGANKNEISYLYKYIDFNLLSFKKKIYYILPSFLKKTIYSLKV